MPFVEREALSDANEDYTGLWELVWRLNTLYPQKTSAEKLRLAREAMRSLLDRGYVRVFKDYDDEQGLTTSEAAALLESDEAWLPPSEGHGYYFFTTNEGEAAYRSDEMGLPFNEALDFLKQCDVEGLGMSAVIVYRVKDVERPAEGKHIFREKEGEGWADLRKRSNAEALEFINGFAGREDVVFFVNVTFPPFKSQTENRTDN